MGVVVWVLPVVAVVVAVAGLMLAFARWRPHQVAPVSEADRALVDRALREDPSGGDSGGSGDG